MKKIAFLIVFWTGFLFAQITLEEIEISPQGGDVARGIIKNAQKNRTKNLQAIQNFQTKVYAKSVIRILERADTVRFLGVDVSAMVPQRGIYYLSESISELQLQFQPTRKAKENMIASKSVGFRGLFSLNRSQEAWFNFYENRLFAEAFSERHFISPIANDAGNFYRYGLDTIFAQSDRDIYRIQLLPKRSSDAIFYGSIDIEDKTFQIVQVDLQIRKSSQLEYIDSLTLQQTYSALGEYWLPEQLTASAHIAAFDVRARFDGFTVFSDRAINLPWEKKNFDNEVFVVQNSALEQNNFFWEQVRRVPLLEDEYLRYIAQEQAEVFQKTPEYKRLLDQKDNAFAIDNVLENNYSYKNSRAEWAIGTRHLFDILQYNPVEGYVWNLFPYFRKWHGQPKNYEDYYLQLRLGVGIFDRWNNFGFKAGFVKSFGDFLDAYLFAEVGRIYTPIHHDGGLQEHLNSLYSLLLRQHDRRLFEHSYAQIGMYKEWLVGLNQYAAVQYTWARNILHNQFSHSWLSQKKTFADNYPFTETHPIAQSIFAFHTELTYTPGLRYERIGSKKLIQDSAFPTFRWVYRMQTGQVQTQYLEFNLKARLKTPDFGDFVLEPRLGGFLQAKSMNFLDYAHFSSTNFHFHPIEQRMLFYGKYEDRPYFMTLPLFDLSTQRYFTAFHFVHDLRGSLWNRIPGIQKIHLKWLWGVNLLWTDGKKDNLFVEFYLGFYNILKFIRVDIVSHYYRNQVILPQVRIQLKLLN